MAAWSRNTLILLEMFAFFGKTTAYGKILKILFRKFSLRHRSTCCVQISWNLADGKSVKSCVAYLTKNFGCLSSCCYWANRAQNLPGPAPGDANVLWVLQISPKSVHFRRSYCRTREHRPNAPWSKSNIRLRPSFEPNNSTIMGHGYWSPHYVCSTHMVPPSAYSSRTFYRSRAPRRPVLRSKGERSTSQGYNAQTQNGYNSVWKIADGSYSVKMLCMVRFNNAAIWRSKGEMPTSLDTC